MAIRHAAATNDKTDAGVERLGLTLLVMMLTFFFELLFYACSFFSFSLVS